MPPATPRNPAMRGAIHGNMCCHRQASKASTRNLLQDSTGGWWCRRWSRRGFRRGCDGRRWIAPGPALATLLARRCCGRRHRCGCSRRCPRGAA
eukprot:12248627-Alexandrium_andersonii.AAC.1